MNLNKNTKKGSTRQDTALSKLRNYLNESAESDWHNARLRKNIRLTNYETDKTTNAQKGTVVFVKNIKDNLGRRYLILHTDDPDQKEAYVSEPLKDVNNIVEFLNKIKSRQMINFLDDTLSDINPSN